MKLIQNKNLIILMFLILTFNLSLSSQLLRRQLLKEIKHSPEVIGIHIIDIKKETSIRINSERPFYPASLIKLALVPTLMEKLNYEEYNLKDTFPLRKNLFGVDSKHIKRKHIGKYFSLENLLYYCFCLSDNNASNILAHYMTLNEINLNLIVYGFPDTSLKKLFLNKRQPGKNQISAKDASNILYFIYNEAEKGDSYAKYFLNLLKNNIYIWGIPYHIPRKVPIAHIVGMNSFVINDAAIVFLDKNPYIITVLINKVVSPKTAKSKIAKISKIAYAHFGTLAK